MSRQPPWSEPVRVHQIGAGLSRSLIADDATRARIVTDLGLAALDDLRADVDLKPTPSGWTLNGRLRAQLAQICGVTLDPLPVTLDEVFTVTYAETAPADADEVVIDLEEVETPDLIEDGKLDLGQAVVEQLALNLDPFPRKPGAEFVQPPEPTEISPFAALKALKRDTPG